MGTVMDNKAGNKSGKFALKSETPRKIHLVNLTDDAWQWLVALVLKGCRWGYMDMPA
jgi:hypothetical protein